MKTIEPLYIALDFESADAALTFLQQNQLQGVPVKVGMELFYKEGPSIIKQLNDRGNPIFLDLKLHDIPMTVKRAMASLASLKVDVVNVHAQGGSEMIAAAKEGLAALENPPLLLAVTQLTSTNQSMLEEELKVQAPLQEIVQHYALLAKNSGADGVVCSVKEVSFIREVCGKQFVTLTPGIRRQLDEHHDQKRVATPFEAGKQGSHSIVVGRSITQAENPLRTYQMIKEELQHGQQSIH
ncbi:orotidine-5'-phosphate decarboxylase [Halobacillus rhizosphaerae]|uniref:orotidine-5'-phosphate decarboxylase n=1 Tax=Halobacillus rhizosphaerae TaxID=3064889 RepID=UPI00398AB327